jgi:hypothetical protein
MLYKNLSNIFLTYLKTFKVKLQVLQAFIISITLPTCKFNKKGLNIYP